MIAIVDYGMGNLRSVQKALEAVGAPACVTADAGAITAADKMVLPGVGAFGQAMESLTKLKLVPVIKKYIKSGKPFLGICLGLQLLFSESEEFSRYKGLGVFPGKVKRFEKCKVPHMGWNQIAIAQSKKDSTLFAGIDDGAYFYFCHSYYGAPKDKKIVAATTSYGVDFASMIAVDNIWAMQFHPEKSQALGLKILQNFVTLP